MNCAVILIPLAKNDIFFNYAYMNRFAACIPRHIKSVIQQFFSDSIVSICRQYRKITQLTRFIVLHKQRIVSTQCPIFLKNIHSSILMLHLPI